VVIYKRWGIKGAIFRAEATEEIVYGENGKIKYLLDK